MLKEKFLKNTDGLIKDTEIIEKTPTRNEKFIITVRNAESGKIEAEITTNCALLTADDTENGNGGICLTFCSVGVKEMFRQIKMMEGLIDTLCEQHPQLGILKMIDALAGLGGKDEGEDDGEE